MCFVLWGLRRTYDRSVMKYESNTLRSVIGDRFDDDSRRVRARPIARPGGVAERSSVTREAHGSSDPERPRSGPDARPHRSGRDQRAPGHLTGLRDPQQLQDRRGDVGEHAAVGSVSPGTVRITGTGLSEWAVLGEPSGSSMWSALP